MGKQTLNNSNRKELINMSDRNRPRRPSRPTPDRIPPLHVNTFARLNGRPYVIAEYLNRESITSLDRSMIQSHVHVDPTDPMRTVVDISIDDIGRRASTGQPNLIGNTSQHRSLLREVRRSAIQMRNRLDVLRRGIVLRVHYRLENERTKDNIRSTMEELHIANRNMFMDINPRDLSDNALVANFTDSIVSQLGSFTHGTDRMMIRITHIDMFYVMLNREGPPSPGTRGILPHNHRPHEHDRLDHHRRHQSVINLTGPCNCDDMFAQDALIRPPSWMMVNRFYRFDNLGKDIILHFQEINDRRNRTTMIPCGRVFVNRSWVINPGARIIFKISVWKNDVVAVHNTQGVARALDVHDLGQPRRRSPIIPDLETVIRMLANQRTVDARQFAMIKRLQRQLDELLYDGSDNGNGNGNGTTPPGNGDGNGTDPGNGGDYDNGGYPYDPGNGNGDSGYGDNGDNGDYLDPYDPDYPGDYDDYDNGDYDNGDYGDPDDPIDPIDPNDPVDPGYGDPDDDYGDTSDLFSIL